MKKADASGAQIAALLGEDERAAGQVTLKPLRGQGDQKTLAWAEAAAAAHSMRHPVMKPEADLRHA
jgi:histidyl-tRNA synthetase